METRLGVLSSMPLLVLSWSPLSAADPVIVPPQAIVEEKTLGEWTVEWWRWMLSVPADVNPLPDETGTEAHQGQAGKVWFLAGTRGDKDLVIRNVTVPTGVFIFFPILNIASVPDPGDPCELLLNQVKRGMDPFDPQNNPTGVSSLECTIDGKAVSGLEGHRETYSQCFEVCACPDNVFGLPEGTGPQWWFYATDGYWLMLEPLAKGNKLTIEFAGTRGLLTAPEFALHVIYNIGVGEPGLPFRRGDVIDDGKVDASDAIDILEYLFLDACWSRSLDAADANDDGEVNIGDPIGLLSFLYTGSGPLPPPGAEACGSDPTPDPLGDCVTDC